MERVLETPQKAFLAGSWQATAHTFPVSNPTTGDIVAQVADCGPAEAKQAVDVAVHLFLEEYLEVKYLSLALS